MADNKEDNVAITGSPNTSTELHFDVRSDHLRTPLLGSLLSLTVPVQNTEKLEQLLVLGQVATIETQNRWHEDPSLKNYIKLNGPLPHLTEIGDITTGKLQIIGAYRTTGDGEDSFYEKTRLAIPPGSGLQIDLVGRKTIETIMRKEFGYGYLGNFYGRQNVPAPVSVKHFGNFEDHGTGEAFMGGVFGPSGSGKSVIAASLIALWAHNPQMGILILDPKGDFSGNFSTGQGTGFDFDFFDMLNKTSGGRFESDKHVITLDELQLEDTDIFVQVLIEKGFLKTLGLTDSRKLTEAVDFVQRFLEYLEESDQWKPTMDWDEINNLEIEIKSKTPAKEKEESEKIPFPEKFTTEIANAYSSRDRASRAQSFLDSWQQQEYHLKRIWDETTQLFKEEDPHGKKRFRVKEILEDTIQKGKIYILDLNPQKIRMSNDFKIYLVDFIFRKYRQQSYIYYAQKRPGNCLIVLDEAGRFIPQDPGDNERLRNLCRGLTASVKEMRSMRCGFMFITQTITEIQKEIFRQLHFRIYGVGLGIGADADHIVGKEGQDAYDLYRSLPDPRLSGTFSFMVAGILIALGSSGRPMVIEGFSSAERLLEENSHIIPTVLPTLAESGVGEPVLK